RLGNAGRPISPEGMMPWRAISPDGRWVAGAEADLLTRIYPVAGGGTGRSIPGLSPGQVPIAFTADGGWLVVYDPGAVPARPVRIAIATGRIEPWRSFGPADPAGVKGIFGIWTTSDGSSQAYA